MWKFKPILKKTIWGGHKIARLKGFVSDDKIGECWLLSSVPGSISEVCEGPDCGLSINELIEKHGAALLGKLNYIKYNDTFPLLIKIIDSATPLSVQVHPDNDLAAELGSPRGKTEMWYVLESEPEAELSLGFSRDLSPEMLNAVAESGEIENMLNRISVKSGDVFFIPAGTVHAIGAGCLLMEVQQTSDDTFRIYDYNRRDDDGNLRTLHLDLAARALNFNATDGSPVKYTAYSDIPVNVVRSPFFTTNVMTIDEPTLRDYSECDSFICIVGVNGTATLVCDDQSACLEEGELVLVPASTDNVRLIPDENFTAIEVYIKQ